MGRILGFVGLIVVVGIVMVLYSHQVAPGGGGEKGGATPKTTIDVAGVKNYLVAVAGAERQHMASEGKYVSFSVVQGEVTYNTNANRPYIYSADVGDNSFKITATYNGPPGQGAPEILSIDESMQISQ